MTLESGVDHQNQSIESKMGKDLYAIQTTFHDIGDKLQGLNSVKKRIDFGGEVYEDSEQVLYLPLDKELDQSMEYKGGFKEEDSHFLCVLKPIPNKGGSMQLQLFEKGIDGSLSDENKVMSCSVLRQNVSDVGGINIETLSKSLAPKDASIVVKNVRDYLDVYFARDEAIKTEERINDIKVKEILSKESEQDPEELLKQLQG